jgi:hypothetical protein
VSRRPSRRRGWLVFIGMLFPVTAVAAWFILTSGAPGAQRPVGCTVAAGAGHYSLELPQAANAATIAAVAAHLGLSDHAVSIALATALQESKLHNLPYGDRDSVGLFQQRPSQGWGPRERLLEPHYAASTFFAHLAQVPGWQTMPVATAAQAVQRSAAGSAYADWEPEARAIAQALTGEVPRGIACAFGHTGSSVQGLTSALASDLGPRATGVPASSKQRWRVASWLVAQAAQYDVVTVRCGGWQWTRASGAWSLKPARSPRPIVSYAVGAPAATS